MKTSDVLRSALSVFLVTLFASSVADKVGGVDAVVGLVVSSLWLLVEVAAVIFSVATMEVEL